MSLEGNKLEFKRCKGVRNKEAPHHLVNLIRVIIVVENNLILELRVLSINYNKKVNN